MNCDGRVSAADVAALVPLLPAAEVGACERGDVDENGFVDEEDLDALVEILFHAQ